MATGRREQGEARGERDLVRPEGVEDLIDAEIAAARGAQTPCEALGQNEIIIREIAISTGDVLEWRMFVCNTPGRAVLGLMDSMGTTQDLVDQRVPPPNPIQKRVMPPMQPAGSYTLFWGLAPSGPDWQMVAEVLVNGVVVFRHFKSSQGNRPFSKGFLDVRVL